MIAKDIFPIYSQYNEDLVLSALLYRVKKGFYVDVGANHEEYHSVTKHFYKAGWNGINIEPIPRLLKEFTEKRKRDTNLQMAVSNTTTQLTLREYPQHDGLSTLDEGSKNDPRHASLPYVDYLVPVDTLRNIFDTHKIATIDFLKIDVEGYEQEVIEGNDWERYRPTVICIEANHRSTNWQKMLLAHKYKLFIFDGLNEYYIAAESFDITKDFAERVALRAHSGIRKHILKEWRVDLERIRFLEEFTDRQDAAIKAMQVAINDLQQELDNSRKINSILEYYWSRLKERLRAIFRRG